MVNRPQAQAAGNGSSCLVLGRQPTEVAAQGSPVMNWGRLEGVMVRQAPELGRHLALELAEVRQNSVRAERLRQRPPAPRTALQAFRCWTLCRLLPPDSLNPSHQPCSPAPAPSFLVVKGPLQTPF